METWGREVAAAGRDAPALGEGEEAAFPLRAVMRTQKLSSLITWLRRVGVPRWTALVMTMTLRGMDGGDPRPGHLVKEIMGEGLLVIPGVMKGSVGILTIVDWVQERLHTRKVCLLVILTFSKFSPNKEGFPKWERASNFGYD
ncbi:hypothetical protein Taro_018766 [Colocasia esculenta]|uniref:Uncharacterized protein n=1 Tax=Colocasia esculenta TaxID=4460 RepID=A0A843UUM6_COLES|nr:hypothetical protein [Colocasia esculenta]